MTQKKLTPAEKAIQAAGGVRELADLLGVDETCPFKWPRSKDVGGCEGRIPHRHHKKLLQIAKRYQWDFEPIDLIPNF